MKFLKLLLKWLEQKNRWKSLIEMTNKQTNKQIEISFIEMTLTQKQMKKCGPEKCGTFGLLLHYVYFK
jgi:hypothetical protein